VLVSTHNDVVIKVDSKSGQHLSYIQRELIVFVTWERISIRVIVAHHNRMHPPITRIEHARYLRNVHRAIVLLANKTLFTEKATPAVCEDEVHLLVRQELEFWSNHAENL